MPSLDSNLVAEKLKRLRASEANIFGATYHRFLLNAPLAGRDMTEFESKYQIVLPLEYRDFLTQFGNGGAGPYYGVFPLGFMDGSGQNLKRWEEGDGFIGILSEPFPLREVWNEHFEWPSDALLEEDKEEYDRQIKIHDEKSYDPATMNGAIPICHMGCALRVWLVVTGEEAGHLWYDGRADGSGISPLTDKNGSRATFASWYGEWLEDALRITG